MLKSCDQEFCEERTAKRGGKGGICYCTSLKFLEVIASFSRP